MSTTSKIYFLREVFRNSYVSEYTSIKKSGIRIGAKITIPIPVITSFSS